jgi:cell division protein FtsB
MGDNVESLILEHLRSIRGDIAALALKVDTLTTRVASLEEHVAGLRRDLALIHGDMAAM